MIWGLSTSTFTLVHVLLSLIGIASGFVVIAGLLGGGRERRGWTALFLATTVATSVTGFGFPVDHLLPSHIVGILSLAILAAAIVARYPMRLRGAWRWVYVIGAAIALYLNVFVGVVQAFLQVSALRALAPQQTEPPFVVTQVAVLAVFIVLVVLAARRCRGTASRTLDLNSAEGADVQSVARRG